MVNVVQLVRTPDCDSGGRGFESRLSPKMKPSKKRAFLFLKKFQERKVPLAGRSVFANAGLSPKILPFKEGFLF